MQVEIILGILSLLFLVSILTDKIGYKFGVPALLLFLGVGMLFGPEGLGSWGEIGEIEYMLDLKTAQAIGTISLCIILFSGGLDTKQSDINPVISPGVTLATLGVFLTCVITGVIIWAIFGWLNAVASVGIWTALLMAATMSSTDSASVFSILRTNGIRLKHNLRPLLELESGANDPMAYILTSVLIGIVTTPGMQVSGLEIIQDIMIQLVMGAVMGMAFGEIVVRILPKLKLSNESLYPIFVLTACIAIFSGTFMLKGNPFLAVYVGGLIIGNSHFTRRRQTKSFFDGLAWLSQLVMFLMLGLMVRPSELFTLEVGIPCLIISVVMIFISRPLSVFLCMIPFKKFKQHDKLFLSAVGLKGAVPIIFAIMCLCANVEHSSLLFHVVFACTLVSLIVQGTSIGAIAKSLGLALPGEKEHRLQFFDIDLPEEITSSARECEVTDELLAVGNMMKDIKIPEKTLVIMVRREDRFFVPQGKTELKVGDQLLIISDNNAELVEQEISKEDEEILTHFWHNTKKALGNFISSKWHKLHKKQ